MSDDPVGDAIRRDPRYPRAAYEFVSEALHDTVAARGRAGHVTAHELLEGIRRLAHEQFGPLARTVFRDWGVASTDDFGQIVFNLVAVGAMGKTEEDDVADFARVYSFEDVFPEEAGEVRVHRRDPEDDDAEDDDSEEE